MNPRIVLYLFREQTGPSSYETRKSPRILWNTFGEWRLISHVGPGPIEVVHYSVLEDEPQIPQPTPAT